MRSNGLRAFFILRSHNVSTKVSSAPSLGVNFEHAKNDSRGMTL